MALVVWLSSRSWVSGADRRTWPTTSVPSATLLLVGSGAGRWRCFVPRRVRGRRVHLPRPGGAARPLGRHRRADERDRDGAASRSAGFVLFGLIDGQLAVDLGPSGDVVAIGGETLEEPLPLPASRYDLYGLWLAAAPVVGFGAPLGSWAASKVTDRTLAKVVVGPGPRRRSTTTAHVPHRVAHRLRARRCMRSSGLAVSPLPVSQWCSGASAPAAWPFRRSTPSATLLPTAGQARPSSDAMAPEQDQ